MRQRPQKQISNSPAKYKSNLSKRKQFNAKIEQHNFRFPKPGPQPARPKVGFVPHPGADSEAELLGLMRSFFEQVLALS